MNGLGAPLQRRQFQWFFTGQTISTLGDAFYVIALPWIIPEQWGEWRGIGPHPGAYGLARLITILVGGVLSDRIKCAQSYVLADIARTVLTGLMAFEVVGNHFSLPLIITTVFCAWAFYRNSSFRRPMPFCPISCRKKNSRQAMPEHLCLAVCTLLGLRDRGYHHRSFATRGRPG